MKAFLKINHMLRCPLLAAALLFAGILQGAEDPGRVTVFLFSIDGIRPDYLPRSETPFFDRLMAEGAYSLEVIPPFPSVTFSSHATIATGVLADRHGVTGNSFFDTRTGERHRFAGDQALLEAEPIWTTATRQGIRTLVLDWVKSHNQTGPHATAYFGMAYARNLPDAERVQRVLDTWRQDDPAEHGAPLRFILAYAESPDTEGHRYGPEAPEIEAVMQEVDALLRHAFEEAKALWQRDAGPNDVLYKIALSDHGMARVDTHIHLLSHIDLDPRVVFMGGTTMNQFFFHAVEDGAEREALIQQTAAALREIEPLQVHRREELPEHWGFNHPYRTGDLVVTVPVTYALFRHDGEKIQQPARETGRFFGAHGYDPKDTPEMTTVLLMQRHPQPLGGQQLGPIRLTQVHATVAGLFGIAPAEGADPERFFDPAATP